MFQRLWKKSKNWVGSLVWVDDPRGEYLLDLEQRLERLEKELIVLKERSSASFEL